MLNCHDVSHLIASSESDELGFMKRLEIRLHLMMCRHCNRYAQQIKALGAGARRLVGAQEPTAAELRQLENEICDKICNHGGGAGH